MFIPNPGYSFWPQWETRPANPLAGFTAEQGAVLQRLKTAYATGMYCLTEREVARARFHRWRGERGDFDDDSAIEGGA